MEEQDAIARLKCGDLDGLEILVKRYQVQAVHAAYLIVHDRALAEDVAQETFLRAAERINQFDDARPFGPWFLRSVVNAALKVTKQQNRLIPLDPESPCASPDWLLDGTLPPEAIVESEETRRAVWEALCQLNPDQRAVVVLRHFFDLSDAEAAERLERPLTTIKWWLHTARRRLRELLRPTWTQE